MCARWGARFAARVCLRDWSGFAVFAGLDKVVFHGVGSLSCFALGAKRIAKRFIHWLFSASAKCTIKIPQLAVGHGRLVYCFCVCGIKSVSAACHVVNKTSAEFLNGCHAVGSCVSYE
jgi:hypothetical protein